MACGVRVYFGTVAGAKSVPVACVLRACVCRAVLLIDAISLAVRAVLGTVEDGSEDGKTLDAAPAPRRSGVGRTHVHGRTVCHRARRPTRGSALRHSAKLPSEKMKLMSVR